ncbi:MAG: PLP-dependent aminotransferase family protein [Desulfurococcaceae archaeon]
MARPDYAKFLSSRANLVEPSPIREMVSRIAKKSRETKVISFAAGDPDPDVIPRTLLAEIAKSVFESDRRSVIYSPTEGLPDVVEEIAKFMKTYEGVSADPANILVTHGGSQAIDLVGRLMLDPGDIVVVENPSYVNTILTWRHYGVRVVGVPMDDEGMRVDVLEETVKKLKSDGKVVKLVYTIPTGQNPSGITMSVERRKYLLEVASTHDLLVVEDGAYNYLVYEPVEAKSLKHLDKEDRVIFAGSFSKVLGTGLRVGWLYLPSELVALFKSAKGPTDMCPSVPSQLIVASILKKGLFEEIRRKAVEAYKEKRDLMLKAIREHLPGLKHTKPVAGMFTLLWLPGGTDGWSFAIELLERHAVATIPAAPFYTDESGKSVLRLNFSMPPKDLIEEGVKRIAELLREKRAL